MNQEIESLLYSIYHNPKSPGSLSSVRALYDAARKLNSKVRLTDVKQFLHSEKDYGVHFASRVGKQYPQRQFISYGLYETLQADLADMSEHNPVKNRHVHYLLVIIDVWSKFAWVYPLTSKHAEKVADAFDNLLRENPTVRPRSVVTDAGTEFTAGVFKTTLNKYNVSPIITKNAANAERFIRTIKTRIHKYMTQNDTDVYVDVIQDLVHSYNHSKSRTHGLCPAEITPSHNAFVRDKLYGKREKMLKTKAATAYCYSSPTLQEQRSATLRIGDVVRIGLERRTFHKGYRKRYSEEMFIISRIEHNSRDPITMYRLSTHHPTDPIPIDGKFYKEQLFLVKESTDDDDDDDNNKKQDPKSSVHLPSNNYFESELDSDEGEEIDYSTFKKKQEPPTTSANNIFGLEEEAEEEV